MRKSVPQHIRDWVEKPTEVTEKLDKTQAIKVLRTTQTEGWEEIKNWVEKQIDIMRTKLELSADIGEIKIESLKTNKNNKLALICVENNYYKHAIKAYKLFLSQIDNWIILANQKEE